MGKLEKCILVTGESYHIEQVEYLEVVLENRERWQSILSGEYQLNRLGTIE